MAPALLIAARMQPAVVIARARSIYRRRAAALLGLCLVLRIVSLVRLCQSDDEATYAVVAREMLTGHALYLDAADHKPPAIYVTYEVTQAIAGPIGGMVLLHALLIGVVWATGLLLAGIVRRYGPSRDERVPWFAALLWIVFTTTLNDTNSLAANCELFMMLPLVGSVAVYLGARNGRLAPLVATGALVGVAALFKYQAAVQLPVFAIAWMIASRATPRAFAGLIALGIGVALPIGAAVVWLSAHGALAAAVFWFRFNFSYIDAGGTTGLVMLERFVVRGGFVVGSAALLYALAGAGVLGSRGSPLRWFAIGWLVTSALAVSVGGRFFGHYFHQLTAPLVVFAAPAAVRLYDRRRTLFLAATAIPAAAFLVLGAIHDRVMSWAGEPDPDYASVVAWLDDHSAPSDSICIWGNSPVLYFEADRPLGCRFVFANYLTGASPATPSQTDPTVDSSINIVWPAWDMLADDLRNRRPTFIIDGSPGNVAFYGKYPPSKFPRLARALACDYVAEAEVAGMRIYRRQPTSKCAAASEVRR